MKKLIMFQVQDTKITYTRPLRLYHNTEIQITRYNHLNVELIVYRLHQIIPFLHRTDFQYYFLYFFALKE